VLRRTVRKAFASSVDPYPDMQRSSMKLFARLKCSLDIAAAD